MPPRIQRAIGAFDVAHLLRIGAIVVPIIGTLASGGLWIVTALSARVDSVDARLNDTARTIAVIEERSQHAARDIDYLMRRQTAARPRSRSFGDEDVIGAGTPLP